MIETSPLPGANLPDGPAASQAGGYGASGAELRRGFKAIPTEPIPLFSSQNSGGENTVGDPFTYGGFLGRPQGTQR